MQSNEKQPSISKRKTNSPRANLINHPNYNDEENADNITNSIDKENIPPHINEEIGNEKW